MEISNLQKAKELLERIEILNNNIKTLEWAVSDSFKAREMSLNILNNTQSNGYCFIPESISKEVCKIILNQCKVQVAELSHKFSKL